MAEHKHKWQSRQPPTYGAWITSWFWIDGMTHGRRLQEEMYCPECGATKRFFVDTYGNKKQLLKSIGITDWPRSEIINEWDSDNLYKVTARLTHAIDGEDVECIFYFTAAQVALVLEGKTMEEKG